MKITATVRRLYEEQLALNSLLRDQIGPLEQTKRPEWFFVSRIKELESFAQKLETGRVPDPSSMDDFLACTFVVENRASIADAVTHVERFCEVQSMRPPNQAVTHKRSESFPFDDLRLYVKLRADPAIHLTGPVHNVVFEVQIKTFLQHAWSIATHDLIYKGDRIDWSRARVAFQIRAMLEHAEASIEKVDQVATASTLAMSDRATDRIRHVLEWIDSTWEAERLPKDRVRLARTVWELLDSMKITIEELKEAIEADTRDGEGSLLVNLSPYGAIVRALARHRRDKVSRFLQDRSNRSARLFVTPEMEVDDLVDRAVKKRVVKVS